MIIVYLYMGGTVCVYVYIYIYIYIYSFTDPSTQAECDTKSGFE